MVWYRRFGYLVLALPVLAKWLGYVNFAAFLVAEFGAYLLLRAGEYLLLKHNPTNG